MMSVYFKKDRNKWCAKYRNKSKLFSTMEEAEEFDRQQKKLYEELSINKAPLSRKAALASDSITYMSSRPCVKGHACPRYTKTRTCVMCVAENRDDEYNRKMSAEWKKRHKDRVAAKSAERRAKQLQATPAWADKRSILSLYETSKRLTEETGTAHHVDHIVPLISNIVCGLHCEDNLRVSTMVENLSKSNKYWPDMP